MLFIQHETRCPVHVCTNAWIIKRSLDDAITGIDDLYLDYYWIPERHLVPTCWGGDSSHPSKFNPSVCQFSDWQNRCRGGCTYPPKLKESCASACATPPGEHTTIYLLSTPLLVGTYYTIQRLLFLFISPFLTEYTTNSNIITILCDDYLSYKQKNLILKRQKVFHDIWCFSQTNTECNDQNVPLT